MAVSLNNLSTIDAYTKCKVLQPSKKSSSIASVSEVTDLITNKLHRAFLIMHSCHSQCRIGLWVAGWRKWLRLTHHQDCLLTSHRKKLT